MFDERNPGKKHRKNEKGNAGERGGTRGNEEKEKEEEELIKEKEIQKKKKTPNLSESDDIRGVFDFWVSTFWSGKGTAPRLDEKRRGKIRARLKESFTASQLKQAISGCRLSDFHVTNGYTKLETILRDAGTVEDHMARIGGRGAAPPVAMAKPREVCDAERRLSYIDQKVLKPETVLEMERSGELAELRKTVEDWNATNPAA